MNWPNCFTKGKNSFVLDFSERKISEYLITKRTNLSSFSPPRIVLPRLSSLVLFDEMSVDVDLNDQTLSVLVL